MLLPFTELDFGHSLYYLSCDSPFLQTYFSAALPGRDVWATLFQDQWSLDEIRALFFAASHAVGSPFTTTQAEEIVTRETADAFRLALIEAVDAFMSERLRKQRYVN